jgi:hypothetical protein
MTPLQRLLTLGLLPVAAVLSACSGSAPYTKESYYPHRSSYLHNDEPFQDWHARRHGISPWRPPAQQSQAVRPSSVGDAVTDYTHQPKAQPPAMVRGQGAHPDRERWWINRAVRETPSGERVSWHIDQFEYQFRADDDIVRHHATWRPCRRGALLRRTSQFHEWHRQEGTFCRSPHGNWEYAGY